MNNKFEALKEYLHEQLINHELIQHKPIFSVEDGLKELSINASQGFSTLILNADGKFIAILRRDDNQMSFGKIKKALKIHNLQFATKQEVVDISGCEVGYVSPYNPNIETFVDEKILEAEYVYGGTGSPEFDLKIKPTDLVKLANATLLNISKE